MPTLYDETGKKIELPYTPAGEKAAAAQREKNRAAQNAGTAPQAQPTKSRQGASAEEVRRRLKEKADREPRQRAASRKTPRQQWLKKQKTKLQERARR